MRIMMNVHPRRLLNHVNILFSYRRFYLHAVRSQQHVEGSFESVAGQKNLIIFLFKKKN